jgi:hypothetical protein
MLFLRVAFLAVLLCLHVVGGAVLFRRLFPRESPWWGFFLPTLALVSLLNFIEHLVALPTLVWLLPFSTGGLIWLMVRPGCSWKGLRLPSLLFAGIFSFTLAIKCLQPDVNFYYTEGLTDLNRILDFCLGDKLPPTDSWLPPYEYTGYYAFMHYGASVLKRLFYVDLGTAYNLGFALLNALTMLACAAAAHSISRYRTWVAVITLIVVASGFTGSTPIHAVLNPQSPNPIATCDIGNGTPDSMVHKEFSWLLKKSPPEIAYRMYPPGFYVYYPEFHATIAGHSLALLAVFAAIEVLRRKRTVFPWIYLLVVPILTIISCPWFFIIVALLAWPTLLLAWKTGRHPTEWRFVFFGATVTTVLLWPTIDSFAHGAIPLPFDWTFDLNRDLWTVVIQCWPIYVPWVVLCFAWKQMSFTARWLHFALVPILISVEIFYFSDRATTLEKTWSGAFGVGQAILYPILFIQQGWLFRGLSVVLILTGFLSMGAWIGAICDSADWHGSFLHLEGDYFIQTKPQLYQMEKILGQLRGQTVLAGKAQGAWFESPCLPAFTENRSFLGWTNAEESCGHPVEAHEREKETNAFYDGTLPAPLAFLQVSDISAVLVWPDDKISTGWLDKMKAQLDPEYTYFDCKGDGPENAGLFLKKTDLP